MSIRVALVDRARVVRRLQAERKVEGTTQMAAVHGEWFRCRLTLPSANQSPDVASGARRVVREPTLLYGVRDLAGDPLALTVENEVEIVSKQLGTATWQVQSAPEPLRKRRRVIGYQATLRKVEVIERTAA